MKSALKCLSLAALLLLRLNAATLHGTIFDEETQLQLARTRVALIPLPGTAGGAVSVQTDERGAYLFPDVPPGWYLIRATRLGYAAAEYGQSRPGRPGTPVQITAGVSAVTDPADARNVIMRHQAVIMGSVVDDNNIGIPGWPVSLYTSRPPIQRVAEATTDDRGSFRFGELEPGTYIARSGGGGLDDTVTLAPSYFKFGTAVSSAERVRVRTGDIQTLIVIHTVEGPLYELGGEVTGPVDAQGKPRPLRLTLITDTGRRLVATSAGRFSAANIPPGNVELLAEGFACAGYQRVPVDRNIYVHVECPPLMPVSIAGTGDYPLIARRCDLDGAGPEQPLAPGSMLPPGHWEFTVQTKPQNYLASIQNQTNPAPPQTPVDGWFAFDIAGAPSFAVTLSTKPATIAGTVSSPAKSSIGAPVYLELLNPDALEVPIRSWATRADERGNFSFKGLPPGSYRLVSSFEVDSDDPLARDKATNIALHEGETANVPLAMIVP